MQNLTISSEEFQLLIKDISEIKNKISGKSLEKNFAWIDNSDFMKILKISRRTAQSYRDRNLISFTIIGNKIYYKMSDVEDLMNRHLKKRLE